MIKTIATAAGIVLMASSFALAGQTVTKPAEQPAATQSQRSQTTTPKAGKKHHHKKHHKKHHKTATKQ